ncbi:hypothetical protein [Mucisphaera sp.]|uniref:hypothetical protein n=1 Tax=Mucisphaera sp. TaxID=2913024 RepID=UPI003D0B3564
MSHASKRFPWATILMVTIGVMTLAGGTLAYLAASKPSHVREALTWLDDTPTTERRATAESLEQRLASLFADANSSIDADTRALLEGKTASASLDGTGRRFDFASASAAERNQPQQVRMTFNEANAWLSERLGAWMANQGASLPEFASDFLINQVDGQLVLAFKLKTDEVTGWVSLFTDFTFQTTGEASIKIARIDAGTLRLPRQIIASQLENYADQAKDASKAQTIAAAFHGRSFDPVFPVDKKASVRLTGLKVDGEGVTLELIRESR